MHACRRPWTVETPFAVGGFVTTYANNFSFATVRGSGHMVPLYKPQAALELITRFVNDQPLQHYIGPYPSFQYVGAVWVCWVFFFVFSPSAHFFLSLMAEKHRATRSEEPTQPAAGGAVEISRDRQVRVLQQEVVSLQAEITRLRALLALCTPTQ
jgi:hypothetical protein